jgi:hypothetical protein
MPLEFGFGGNSIYYKNENNEVKSTKQVGLVALAYFGLSGTFKPIR